MADAIDNNDDYLDVRDIIARFEELETELTDLQNADEKDESAIKAWEEENNAEFVTLGALLEDMKGNGGDEQWRGDWYPVSMIRDSYFNDAMDELLEDIGEIKKYADRPSYIKIEIDYDALQSDYTSVEFDGVTYWYR